jgi:conjugal transfer/entry exclusion protein
MPNVIQEQNARTLATLRGAIAAGNATAQQFPTASAQLAALRSQLQSASGAQQAAELQGLLSAHGAQELTLLRQQLTAEANAQVVALSNTINRDLQGAALADAVRRDAVAAPIRRKDMRVEAVGFPTGGTP